MFQGGQPAPFFMSGHRVGSISVLLILLTLSGDATRSPAGVRQSPRPPDGSMTVRPTTWAEARAIVERLEDILPPPLRAVPRADRPARWPLWLADRRQALEERLAQGDVDSLVNLLLF